MDHRTDQYSLGVVLYEMLTGVLPFDSTNPSELVYCHIARVPVPVCSINPDVPHIVSDIIAKLLSKNPQDRYQSIYGLKADLRNCLNQLKESGDIKHFDLGMDDRFEQYQKPQKLYSREQEKLILLDAFDKVCTGECRLFLVTGDAGVGKTALHQFVESVPISIDTAMPLGIVMIELISNSIKHAFPDGRSGKIVIRMNSEGETIQLDYNDNGIGLSMGFNASAAVSLGMEIIKKS